MAFPYSPRLFGNGPEYSTFFLPSMEKFAVFQALAGAARFWSRRGGYSELGFRRSQQVRMLAL